MRIPGITHIACCQAADLPKSLELEAMAEMTPSLEGVTFSGLKLTGDATLDIEDSNEHNGINKKAVLVFPTLSGLPGRSLAFAVTCLSGETFLIGTRDSVPSVSVKDSWGPPQNASRMEVTVSLSSPCAWLRIDSLVPVSDTEWSDSFGYDTWREVTEAEIDTIINDNIYHQPEHV